MFTHSKTLSKWEGPKIWDCLCVELVNKRKAKMCRWNPRVWESCRNRKRNENILSFKVCLKKTLSSQEYSWQFRGSIWKSFKRRFSLWNLEKAPLKGWEPLSIRQSTGDFNKSLGPSALEFQQGASELSQGEEKKIHAGCCWFHLEIVC